LGKTQVKIEIEPVGEPLQADCQGVQERDVQDITGERSSLAEFIEGIAQ
jgi:hypothetical protein